jgi:phosphoglycolate phosphatase
MSRNTLRLLVFDWDGTLIDSIGSIVGCVQATLDELGEPPAAEEAIRRSIGLGLRETVEAFKPGCDDELFDRVVDVYRRLWNERFCREPVLFDGVRTLLRELSSRGYLLAVATAKSRGGLDHDLGRTGLKGLFSSTRTVSEAPSKPAPEMLFQILEELGTSSRESVMIGDTIHDLEMAANAGMPSFAVLSGCESRAALENRAPEALFESVTEVLPWLDGRS